jgi:MerR family redox-sensitive transcriptional activator SoxR
MEMTIGEVGHRVGLAPSTIRYYEKVGLLPVPRRQSIQRRYDAAILGRIHLVQAVLAAGFTIAEAQIFILGFSANTPPSVRWKTLAASKVKELDELLDRTRKMKRLLQTSFKCGCLKLEDCERLLRFAPSERR